VTAEPNASIDDLLRHEEDSPPGAKPTSGTVAWLIKAVVGAAVLAGVGVLALRAGEVGLAYPLAFAAVFGLFVLRRVVGQVAPQPLPRVRVRGRGEEDGLYRWHSGDGLRRAVTRWENRLQYGDTDPPRFTRVMQPALTDVVNERLWQRHGLTMASDPARARVLLGDALWAFLTEPTRRPPSPAQMVALIGRLEQV
jgi:hypothetical protein